MKKLALILILNLGLLNAYTLVLNDNSFVKGELIYIGEDFTFMKINGVQTNIANSKIKKRFYTQEELAVIEKEKQIPAIPETKPVASVRQEPKSLIDDELFKVKTVNQGDEQKHITMPRTGKYNVYVNLDIADKLYGISSLPGYSFQTTDKQDVAFGFGAEYNDNLIGLTKYTLGAMLQLERTITSGKYSGTNIYARVEHPFDPKKTNNYLGFELNLFNTSISGLSSEFTNISFSPKLGFAIYERSYFDKGFVEVGIRRIAVAMKWVDATYGYNWNTDFTATGLYFLMGMSF